MYKNLGLLLIPFAFSIFLQVSLHIFENDYEKKYSIINKNLFNINIHKNFNISKNFNKTINFSEKDKFILFVKPMNKLNFASINKNLFNINIHKNFNISKNFNKTINFSEKDKFILFVKPMNKLNIASLENEINNISDYNFTQIIEIFSEKFIAPDYSLAKKFINEDFHDKPKISTILKNIEIQNVPDNTLSYPVHFVSSDWKKMFSNKKINFIETVLPLIFHENQKILLERQRLIKIKNYLQIKKTLNKNDIDYLNRIAKKYYVTFKNKHKIDLLNELLISVNIIPNSIVLAQAANESGWGSSRFAKEYNALFGQYTYDENNGIIPFKREKGKKHLVRYFSSFNKSVESYFKNINTHYAYKRFREVRSQINKKDLNKSIKILTQFLDVYAEDEFYVNTLNSIIDTNNFEQFDIKPQTFINS